MISQEDIAHAKTELNSNKVASFSGHGVHTSSVDRIRWCPSNRVDRVSGSLIRLVYNKSKCSPVDSGPASLGSLSYRQQQSWNGMQQGFSYRLLLVPRSTRRVSQHWRPGGAKVVDCLVSPACLVHCFLHCHEGHSEQWKGLYFNLL